MKQIASTLLTEMFQPVRRSGSYFTPVIEEHTFLNWVKHVSQEFTVVRQSYFEHSFGKEFQL